MWMHVWMEVRCTWDFAHFRLGRSAGDSYNGYEVWMEVWMHVSEERWDPDLTGRTWERGPQNIANCNWYCARERRETMSVCTKSSVLLRAILSTLEATKTPQS